MVVEGVVCTVMVRWASKHVHTEAMNLFSCCSALAQAATAGLPGLLGRIALSGSRFWN